MPQEDCSDEKVYSKEGVWGLHSGLRGGAGRGSGDIHAKSWAKREGSVTLALLRIGLRYPLLLRTAGETIITVQLDWNHAFYEAAHVLKNGAEGCSKSVAGGHLWCWREQLLFTLYYSFHSIYVWGLLCPTYESNRPTFQPPFSFVFLFELRYD